MSNTPFMLPLLANQQEGMKMSEENQTQEEQQERESFRMGDDLIAVVRELIQLSLLTGTNIVDHMRAVRCEVVDGTVIPTIEYIEAYNSQIEELAKQAQAEAESMQEQLADDEKPLAH